MAPARWASQGWRETGRRRVRNRGPPIPMPAILVAVALLGVSQQPAGAGIRAAYGMTVPQALAALQEATEKLEFDEDKLLKAESNLALDKAAVQDDLHGINHPLAVGLRTAEQVMNKGKIDTRKLEADRPTVPVLEAIVEEDKKRLVGAQLDYERAKSDTPSAVSASPSSSSSPQEPKQTPDEGSSTRSGGVEGAVQNGGGGEQSTGRSHYDDSPYYPSRHFVSCPPCQDGTPQEIADWLESTIEGMAWLQSQSGLDWLLSSKGQRWLETAPGAEWPFTQAGESFFTSDWGRKFLQSRQGHVWLKTPPGQRWLREHQPWASSVLRIRNAAALSFFAVCFAGVLSAYFTPKGEL